MPADEHKIDIDGADDDDEESDDDEFNKSLTNMIRNRRASRLGSGMRRRRSRRKSSMYPSSGNEDDDEADDDEDDDASVMKMYDGGDDNEEDQSDSDDDEKTKNRKRHEQQQRIIENIQIQKDIMTNLRNQPWRMKKKLKALRLAQSYVERYEGRLPRNAEYKAAFSKAMKQFQRLITELLISIMPWQSRIKMIESHFGTVVSSYFIFTRWLFCINLVQAVLTGFLIIFPELLIGDPYGTSPRKSIPSHDLALAQDLDKLWAFEGYLKYSPIFYGFYGKIHGTYEVYPLPLMYFLVNLAAIGFCLISILRRMASNSRMSKMADKDEQFTFSWRLYASWDFMIGNRETANNKKAEIANSLREAILEYKEKKKKNEKNALTVFLRVVANILVIMVLAASAYAVNVVVQKGSKLEQLKIKNPVLWAKTTGFWEQNEVSIVMSLITQIYPTIFDVIGMMEHYHPRIALRWQLTRILALYLLNLYTLIISLKDKIDQQLAEVNSNQNINCTSATTQSPGGVPGNLINNQQASCGNNTAASEYKMCWETMVGQEMVKLTVMDLVMTGGSILIIDFFRGMFVRYANQCWCWDLEMKFPEYGEFKIAENILHVIYNQGMIWMGAFFAPGLPVMNIFKLLVLVYMRAWAVMMCNIPHEVIFKLGSNNFYFAILLLMLFVCFLPTGYAMVSLQPSHECGPYSKYKLMYHVLTDLIKKLPTKIQDVIDIITSPAVIIPTFILLIMAIYYLISLVRSLREANKDTKNMLEYERTEGKKKIYAMAEARRKADNDIAAKIANNENNVKVLPSFTQGGMDLSRFSPAVVNALMKLSSQKKDSGQNLDKKPNKFKSLVSQQIDKSRNPSPQVNQQRKSFKSMVDKTIVKKEQQKVSSTSVLARKSTSKPGFRSVANDVKNMQKIQQKKVGKTGSGAAKASTTANKDTEKQPMKNRAYKQNTRGKSKQAARKKNVESSTENEDNTEDEPEDHGEENSTEIPRKVNANTTKTPQIISSEQKHLVPPDIIISPDNDDVASEQTTIQDRQMVKIMYGNKEKLISVDDLHEIMNAPSTLAPKQTPVAVVKGKQMKNSPSYIRRSSTSSIDAATSTDVPPNAIVVDIEDVHIETVEEGSNASGPGMDTLSVPVVNDIELPVVTAVQVVDGNIESLPSIARNENQHVAEYNSNQVNEEGNVHSTEQVTEGVDISNNRDRDIGVFPPFVPVSRRQSGNLDFTDLVAEVSHSLVSPRAATLAQDTRRNQEVDVNNQSDIPATSRQNTEDRLIVNQAVNLEQETSSNHQGIASTTGTGAATGESSFAESMTLLAPRVSIVDIRPKGNELLAGAATVEPVRRLSTSSVVLGGDSSAVREERTSRRSSRLSVNFVVETSPQDADENVTHSRKSSVSPGEIKTDRLTVNTTEITSSRIPVHSATDESTEEERKRGIKLKIINLFKNKNTKPAVKKRKGKTLKSKKESNPSVDGIVKNEESPKETTRKQSYHSLKSGRKQSRQSLPDINTDHTQCELSTILKSRPYKQTTSHQRNYRESPFLKRRVSTVSNNYSLGRRTIRLTDTRRRCSSSSRAENVTKSSSAPGSGVNSNGTKTDKNPLLSMDPNSLPGGSGAGVNSLVIAQEERRCSLFGAETTKTPSAKYGRETTSITHYDGMLASGTIRSNVVESGLGKAIRSNDSQTRQGSVRILRVDDVTISDSFDDVIYRPEFFDPQTRVPGDELFSTNQSIWGFSKFRTRENSNRILPITYQPRRVDNEQAPSRHAHASTRSPRRQHFIPIPKSDYDTG